MKVSIIVAVAKNHVIGDKNKLPWSLSEDLRYFRSKTWGKAIIMGHNTFRALPVILDNRQCIVLTRGESVAGKGDFYKAISVEHALDLAQEHAKANNYEEIMVAGGSQTYNLFFSHATTMYITEVDLYPEGDAYFPQFDESNWHCTETKRHTSKSGIGYKHMTWKLNEDIANCVIRQNQ